MNFGEKLKKEYEISSSNLGKKDLNKLNNLIKYLKDKSLVAAKNAKKYLYHNIDLTNFKKLSKEEIIESLQREFEGCEIDIEYFHNGHNGLYITWAK